MGTLIMILCILLFGMFAVMASVQIGIGIVTWCYKHSVGIVLWVLILSLGLLFGVA